jgi:BolA protein
MGAVAEAMRRKLSAAFAPERLEIADDSERHAGHAGARPGGETHFSVLVVAKAFEGAQRLQRQRQVYGILAEELAGPVHALSVRALTPAEAAAPRDGD